VRVLGRTCVPVVELANCALLAKKMDGERNLVGRRNVGY
jgi:hypothetical protein